MLEFARVQQPQPAAVEVNAVEVQVIRIFVLLTAVGGEIQHTPRFINADNVLAVEGAGSDLVLQVPVPIIEVEMRPAIALAPLDQLRAAVYNAGAAYLYVGVEALCH